MAISAKIETINVSAKIEKFAGDCPPLLPATIHNSDNSYTEEIPSGGEKELADSIVLNTLGETIATAPYSINPVAPNSIIYKSDGVTELLTIAAGQGKTVGEAIDLLTGAEIYTELSAAQIAAIYEAMPVTGYARPTPSGASTSYALRDDAWVQANIFTDSPSGKVNSLVAGSRTLLVHNNAFGNKNRFTDENGLQVFGSKYMLDHKTGLGWYLEAFSPRTWENALLNSASFTLNVGGNTLTGWFVPNWKILADMADNSSSLGLFFPPFLMSANAILWTSTTDPLVSTRAIYLAANAQLVTIAKSNSNIYHILCRKHYSN